MATKNLYIVRHAQSLSNIGKFDFKHHDGTIELSDAGKIQAAELGKTMPLTGFNTPVYVFSSPYRRAIETAKLFIENLPVTEKFPHGPREIKGPSLLAALREREVKMHPFIQEELEMVSKLSPDERFYYSSQFVESAMCSAERFQNAIFDIKSWSRSGSQANKDADLVVFAHSFVIESWVYLDRINSINSETCSPEDANKKIFPLNFEGFGEARRLKNCEYIHIQYQS